VQEAWKIEIERPQRAHLPTGEGVLKLKGARTRKGENWGAIARKKLKMRSQLPHETKPSLGN